MQEIFDAMHEKFLRRAQEKGRSLTPWNYDWKFLRERLDDEIREYYRASLDAGNVPEMDAATADELLDIANFAGFLWKKWKGGEGEEKEEK